MVFYLEGKQAQHDPDCGLPRGIRLVLDPDCGIPAKIYDLSFPLLAYLERRRTLPVGSRLVMILVAVYLEDREGWTLSYSYLYLLAAGWS